MLIMVLDVRTIFLVFNKAIGKNACKHLPKCRNMAFAFSFVIPNHFATSIPFFADACNNYVQKCNAVIKLDVDPRRDDDASPTSS